MSEDITPLEVDTLHHHFDPVAQVMTLWTSAN
jgi:hypothetical protein